MQVLEKTWNNCNSYTLLFGIQNGRATLKNSLVRHTFTYNPAVRLLGIYPREIQTYVYAKTRI